MHKNYVFELITLGEIRRNNYLAKSLNITLEAFYKNILKNKLEILEVIETKYPKYHMFKNDRFKFGAYLFCFAYAKLVCEDFLNNSEIMDDYIRKKFISKYNGKFCNKTYNENLSEFTVFYYILTSIFVESDLYKDIQSLEYEGEGANNKRYEYSFKFKDGKKINFEVKTMTCDPFIKAELNRMKLKDGDLLYKTYFPRIKIEDYIAIDLEYKENEISSDYRKTKKNIKNINYKFKKDLEEDINIGVLCINYGTSIEEFISYIYNEEYGILNKGIDIGNIDSLTLFSMSSAANSPTLDDLYQNNHVLSICNKDNDMFKKLRLDKYICNEGKFNQVFESCKDEYYGIYKYIDRNGYVHIVPSYVKEETINKFFGIVEDGVSRLDTMVNVDKEIY